MKYLYNGIEFPALPEWDKTAYPYAYIVKNEHSSYEWEYGLWVTNNPIGMYSATTMQAANGYTYAGGALYAFNADTFAWELSIEYWETLGSTISRAGYPVWCNTDVLYKSDGTIYLAASDPVPVARENDFYKAVNRQWVRHDAVKNAGSEWVKQPQAGYETQGGQWSALS